MTEIKILEFYPIKLMIDKSELKGTVTVDWINRDLRLRCLHIYHKNDVLYIFFPTLNMISHENGEKVKVPIVDFNNDEEKAELIDEIKRQWPEFLQKWLTKPVNQPRDYFLANKEKFQKRPVKPQKRPFNKKFKKPFRPGGCAPGSNKFKSRG